MPKRRRGPSFPPPPPLSPDDDDKTLPLFSSGSDLESSVVGEGLGGGPVARAILAHVSTDAAGIMAVIETARAAAKFHGGTVTDEQIAELVHAIAHAAPQHRPLRSVAYIIRSLPGRVALALPFFQEQERQEQLVAARAARLAERERQEHIAICRKQCAREDLPDSERRWFREQLERLEKQA